MRSIKIFSFMVALLLLMPLIFSCQKERKEEAERPSGELFPGKSSADSRVADLLASANMHHFTNPVKAPDFELASVQDMKVRLSAYRGKVVLLSFWATW